MSSHETMILAVDGGGSKIAIAARALHSASTPTASLPDSIEADHSWKFTGTGSAHPATWNQAKENITRALESVTHELQSRGKVVSHVVLALAGAGRQADRDRVIDSLRTNWQATESPLASLTIVCVGDIDPLVDYWKHDSSIQTVAMILGTGSIVASRDAQGVLVRAGGWGPVLGDECSGAALGIVALKSVARWLDSGAHRDDISPLTSRTIAALMDKDLSAIDVGTLRPSIDTLLIETAADRSRAAPYSRIVVELALDAQDPEAIQALDVHLQAIAWQIEQVISRSLGQLAQAGKSREVRLVACGGLVENAPQLQQAILQRCRENGLSIAELSVVSPLLAALRYAVGSLR